MGFVGNGALCSEGFLSGRGFSHIAAVQGWTGSALRFLSVRKLQSYNAPLAALSPLVIFAFVKIRRTSDTQAINNDAVLCGDSMPCGVSGRQSSNF